jgi:hypothetical protein
VVRKVCVRELTFFEEAGDFVEGEAPVLVAVVLGEELPHLVLVVVRVVLVHVRRHHLLLAPRSRTSRSRRHLSVLSFFFFFFFKPGGVGLVVLSAQRSWCVLAVKH